MKSFAVCDYRPEIPRNIGGGGFVDVLRNDGRSDVNSLHLFERNFISITHLLISSSGDRDAYERRCLPQDFLSTKANGRHCYALTRLR